MTSTGQRKKPTGWAQVDRDASVLKQGAEFKYDRRFRYTLVHVPSEVVLEETYVHDERPFELTLHVTKDAEIRLNEQAKLGYLEAFSRLADAPEEAFRRFALTWGMLGICEHDLPACHNPPAHLGAWSLRWSFDWVTAPTGCLALPYEPLAVWREFAEEARALLAIAARLHKGERGRNADWQIAMRRFRPWEERSGRSISDLLHDWKGYEKREWFVLGRLLEAWLSLGGVRAGVWWNVTVEKMELELGISQAFHTHQGSGIFTAIARELAYTCAKIGGLALCVGCGRDYSPTRKPRGDRLNFCQRCNESGVPAKLAKRRQRARQAG